MAQRGEASFSSASDIVFDFFCELCFDDNKKIEAEGYCVDCREYVCGSCYSGHNKSRLTRHHVLQDKINMPKDTPLSTEKVSKKITTKCKTHECEPVKCYCKTHNDFGCDNCFATDHISCPGIENIVDKAENILDSKLYRDFISNLQLIQQKSREIEARARENKTVLHKDCADVVSMVRKLKEEFIVMLNDIEQNTIALAENMKSEDEEKMESVLRDCNVTSEEVERLSSEFENLQSAQRVCQLYINMRKAEGQVQIFQEKLSNLEEANVVRTFTVAPNSELTLPYLRSQDILGTISHKYHQVRTQAMTTTTDPSSITANKLASIEVSSSRDSNLGYCSITGSAVVSHNRLIIADRNNSKVKLVDTHTNQLHDELKVSSQPHDITIFNSTKAAVTLPNGNKILTMKVLPSLTKEREITVRGRCQGIAYSQSRLLVTFTDDPRLDIIDLHGNVIRTIENGSDGGKLFKRPEYVCVSRDGETIYVSDMDNNTVTSLTCDGVVKALYKDKELRSPRAVCTDRDGNVYVCGSGSKNVQLITPDCKKIKVILRQAGRLDRFTKSVSYCQDTNMLFIGVWGNAVQVYQMSS